MLTGIEYFRMRTYQEKLNQVLKDSESIKSNKELFINFTDLLSKSIYGIEASALRRNCQVCSNSLSESVIQLDCRHCLCDFKCFESLVDTQLKGNLGIYERLTCPCGEKISRSTTKEIYGGQESFQKILNEVSKKFEPKMTCNICGMDYAISDFKTLECEHRYCINCIQMSVEILINEGRVGDEINCPECQKVIDPYIIYDLIDSALREKYDNFLLRSLQANKGERYIRCVGRPGVNCEFSQFISEDREEFECQVCGIKFCPKCKKQPHPKMTCEQINQQDISSYDPFIRKNLEDGVMKLCPWCSTPVMKDDACKYVTCVAGCQGKKFFCWDCLAKLESKHEMHEGCKTKDVVSNRIKLFFRNIFKF